MRPRLLTILLLLIAGTVVNVGVAWGFAYRPWEPSLGSGQDNLVEEEVAKRLVARYAPHGWQIYPRVAGTRRESGYEHSIVIAVTDPSREYGERKEVRRTVEGKTMVLPSYYDRTHALAVVATGWPMRSLEMGHLIEYDEHGHFTRPDLRRWGAWKVRGVENRSGFGKSVRRFPLVPRPIGFTVNTLLYAVLIWLPFLVVPLRRQVRIRRGLCPACKYPVGESSVCTECGKAVKPRAHPDSVG